MFHPSLKDFNGPSLIRELHSRNVPSVGILPVWSSLLSPPAGLNYLCLWHKNELSHTLSLWVLWGEPVNVLYSPHTEPNTDLKAGDRFYAYTSKQEYVMIFKTNTGQKLNLTKTHNPPWVYNWYHDVIFPPTLYASPSMTWKHLWKLQDKTNLFVNKHCILNYGRKFYLCIYMLIYISSNLKYVLNAIFQCYLLEKWWGDSCMALFYCLVKKSENLF